MKRGGFKRPFFNNYAKFRSNAKSRPLGSTSSGIKDYEDNGEDRGEYADVFTSAVEIGCPYIAWKLYFPDKSKINSVNH